MASWCTACGKYHWAGGCSTVAAQIDQTFAVFERTYVLLNVALLREFAKILNNCAAERGGDR